MHNENSTAMFVFGMGANLAYVVAHLSVMARWGVRLTAGTIAALVAPLTCVLMNATLMLNGNSAIGMAQGVLWTTGLVLLLGLDFYLWKNSKPTNPPSTTSSKT